MEERGAPVKRIVHGGGIPSRLESNLRKRTEQACRCPSGDVTSLGSAIFVFVASGDYASVEEAQDALCPPYTTYLPDERETGAYDGVYSLYRELYFSLGVPDAHATQIGHVLPTLRKMASETLEPK